MTPGRHLSLFEASTRHILSARSRELGRAATLDDLPDTWIDRIAALGFDFVWMLGVWTIGPAGRKVSATNPDWREEYRRVLPDVTDEDIVGSPFAVRRYQVDPDFGGEPALARLRSRLKRRGLRLILDFVPNHVALDHPFVTEHPYFLISGTEEQLAREPKNYIATSDSTIFAHGRDPFFPGWPDTLQLDYRRPALRAAMAAELVAMAGRCDGLRCDMAMLVLPDVFTRTWGQGDAGPWDASDPFWTPAIRGVKERYPEFVFMAESYWGLEWTLQCQGFDFTYDKTMYDRLIRHDAAGVRGHLYADPTYQACSVRFLENHDEPRAAAEFPGPEHRAAAVLTYLVPGLRFIYDGQIEGRTTRASIHLARFKDEPVDADLAHFYRQLLLVAGRPQVASGRFELVECLPAWDDNPTSERFVAFRREADGEKPILVVVNYGPTQSQCSVKTGLAGLDGQPVRFAELLGDAVYERAGTDVASRGLFVDLPPWGYHVLEVSN
jgi:hypothetical protein